MSFKALTYNVWHGLSGRGLFRFSELEPAGRKELRKRAQVENLRLEKPDLLFLQEVNPIGSGSRFYADALGLHEVHQTDQAGIELFGYGLPTNLRTGLTILANPGFRLTKLAGLKLSGRGFLSEGLSFQVAEFRYALVARLERDGESLLAVNLHLHHGPILTRTMEKRLDELVGRGLVPASLALKTRHAMVRAGNRRRSELVRLAQFLEAHRRLDEPVIVAGDFNCWDEELEPLLSTGLINVTAQRVRKPTWDPPTNTENHRFSRLLAPPMRYYENAALLEFIRETLDEPRMLDHILMSKELAETVRDARRVCEREVEGVLGSDHFGLAAVFN